MSKKRKPPVKPETPLRVRVVEWIAYAYIVVFSLWQGAYFPLQFMLMLAMLLAIVAFRDKTLLVTKEALMLLIISALYFISFAIYAENKYAGLVECLRTLIFPLTLMVFHNFDSVKIEKAIFAALMSIAVLGILAYASIINIPGGVIEHNNRMQSVIQYANTTALLMLIGALYSTDKFIASRKAVHVVSGIVFIVSLILTGSRTTFVVAMAVCFIYAFTLVGRRGRIIAAGTLAAAFMIVFFLGIFTNIRLFQITLYEPTLVERRITFSDALSMLRGKWFLGIGAGNWQEWQFRFQSAPYNAKYIHNHYLQVFLDAGVLAPLLFCAVIFPAIFKGIRQKSIHAFILIAVVLHIVLDFDLVFGAVAMITMYSLSKLTSDGRAISFDKFRYAMIAPLLVVVVLWGSEVFFAAADSNLENGKIENAMSGYSAAHVLNPLNNGLYYQMAQSTRDIELTEEYIRIAIDKNPRDSRSISILALIESRNGNYEEALSLCRKLMENRKYSEEHQEFYLDMAEDAVFVGAISIKDYEDILGEVTTIVENANPLYKQYIENR